VLKPGGVARIMIYNLAGISVFSEWVLFALLRGRPGLSRRRVMATYNESPGTKLYSSTEARQLFSRFSRVSVETVIDSGDTLQIQLSERYKHNPILRAAFMLAPALRPLLGRASRFGTTMLIEAHK
jgi:hypothetical protein